MLTLFNTDKLYDVAEDCLKEAGLPIPRNGLLKEAFAKTKFQEVICAALNEAMSDSDFPDVVANIQNKYLMPEYKYTINGTYEPYVFKRTVKDFKPVRAIRTTEYGNLQQVPGEFAEALRFTSNADEAINYQVTLYGARVEHLWHLLINDDIDAFSRKLGMLTRAAYRTKAALVAGIFNLNPNYELDGVPVFNAAHNNTNALALNAANLATAQGQLKNQTDANGNRIFVGKYYLMVCSALEYTANQLWWQGGGALASGAAAIMDRTSANLPMMFADMGMQKPIVNPFLTGNTAWFLIADPMDVPFIEVGELQGLGNPMLLTAKGHWNETVLGYQLDQNFTSQNGCIITHGQDVVDFRGAVRGNA